RRECGQAGLYVMARTAWTVGSDDHIVPGAQRRSQRTQRDGTAARGRAADRLETEAMREARDELAVAGTARQDANPTGAARGREVRAHPRHHQEPPVPERVDERTSLAPRGGEAIQPEDREAERDAEQPHRERRERRRHAHGQRGALAHDAERVAARTRRAARAPT